VTNTLQLNFFIHHENCGRQGFGRIVGARVDVTYLRNKLTLRTRLWNINLKSQFFIFNSLRDIRVYIYDFFKFVGVKVGVENFFLGQSIGIDENNTFLPVTYFPTLRVTGKKMLQRPF